MRNGHHKVAIIGAGFMGRTHLEALRRVNRVEVSMIVADPLSEAVALATASGVKNTSDDYQDALRDPTIEAIHICTPNFLHFPIAKAALEAGKHVVSEKPLAISVEEGQLLVELAAAQNLRNCTDYNLRYYPMVQQMRQMWADNDLGELLVAQGTYSQDWLLYDTDWNWRIDSKVNGPSRVMADIGSHWCDMLEHVTGARITSLCADLRTVHEVRKRPKIQVESFAGKLTRPSEYEEVPIDTEDFGAVIFRVGENGRGAFTASQISAGRKNGLSIELYGTKGSVAWNQERPDELWIGNRDSNNQVTVKDPSLLKPAARAFADYPGGHGEGYDDTFKQVFRRFYQSIEETSASAHYPQFADGLRQLRIIETALKSSRDHQWCDIVE